MNTISMPSEVYGEEYRVAVEHLIMNVNLLHESGYDFEDIPKDVLAIYYSDFILLELLDGGTLSFVQTQLPLHPSSEQHIISSLTAIGGAELARLFSHYFVGKSDIDPEEADRAFGVAARSENIAELAGRLMWSSEQIRWKPSPEVNRELAELSLARKLETLKEH